MRMQINSIGKLSCYDEVKNDINEDPETPNIIVQDVPEIGTTIENIDKCHLSFKSVLKYV